MSGGFGVHVGGCLLRVAVAAVLTAGLMIAVVAAVVFGAPDPA